MYDELIKALHEGAEFLECSTPGIKNSFAKMCHNAADAIEQLQADKAALNGTVTNLLEQIKDLGKPRWIPVTEQLPESGQRVLAVGLHGEAMYIGTYTGGIKETAYRKAKPYKINAGGYGWRSFTWWMPLPQPPKE